MARSRYSIATEIGLRLEISKEGLSFIKRCDPELFKLIKKERKKRGIK